MNAPANIKPSIVSALAKALPELESAKKNKANPAFKSKYADLAAVIEALEPITKHGLWYRQQIHESAEGVTIETLYIHESGESLSAGTLFMPATKRDAQGYGSALSYARRYSLQTAFGLATEDDDGNAAVKASQDAGGHSKREVSPRQTVSDADLTKIIALCEAVGGNQAQVVCDAYKVEALPELNPTQAAAVIKRLNEKLAEKVKAASNANLENA